MGACSCGAGVFVPWVAHKEACLGRQAVAERDAARVTERFMGPHLPPMPGHWCGRGLGCRCAEAWAQFALETLSKKHHSSPPTGEGLDSFLPPRDARQDMKTLLVRMRQTLGELERLLEKSK